MVDVFYVSQRKFTDFHYLRKELSPFCAQDHTDIPHEKAPSPHAPGRISLESLCGGVEFRNLKLASLPEGTVNPADTLPPVDEQRDGIIRLQQRDFPVIDYHVHLKGDLTKEMAHAMSMNFGTNNVDSRFGRLEYALETVEACGLTPDDIWFPSMSIRSSRPVVIYNHFD